MMYSSTLTLSTSYANLGDLLTTAGATNAVNPVSMDQGFFRNTSSTITTYIASGYDEAPTSLIGSLDPGSVLLFNQGFNANLCWVKSASGTPSLDFVVGSQGLVQGNTSETVTVSGTPVSGQFAEFISANRVQGADVKYARPLFYFDTNQSSLLVGGNLYSGTIPANTMVNNGDIVKARFSFITAANAHSRFTNINFNGTPILSAEITANAQWGHFDIEIIRVSSTTARASGFLTITGAGSGEGEVPTGFILDLTGLDFTAVSHLVMYCQSDVNGDLTAKMADAQYIPAP